MCTDQVTTYWTLFLPRLFDLFPKFMAEMYGFCLATAHLQMPQQLARGFMVSNVAMQQGKRPMTPHYFCSQSLSAFILII